MRRNYLFFCILVIVLFICYVNGQNKSKENYRKKEKIIHQTNELKSPFRYVIVAGVSEVEKSVNRSPNDILYLEVLLEESAFTEKKLKTLFKLLEKRFNETNVLFIHVYTSLNAIRTPEENDKLDLKGPIEDVEKKYKYANYTRIKGRNKIFTYSIPGVVNEKEVLIEKVD